MLLNRLRHYFIPTPAALTMLWVAGFWLGITCALFALIAFEIGDPGAGLLSWSVFSAPVSGLLLLVGAWREPRSGPRALILSFTLLLALTAAGAAGVAMSGELSTAPAGVPALLACCAAPLLLPLAGLALFFGLKARPELRQIVQSARYRRVHELLRARGEVSFAEIGRETSLPEAEAAALLAGLVRSGELMAFLDLEGRRAYSTATLAARQRHMLAMIKARGEVRLAELAAELRAPATLISGWLRQLVQRGQFSGYVDWEGGLLFSAEASAVQQRSNCPRCGGQLNLAGHGVIQCQHCGVEVFG